MPLPPALAQRLAQRGLIDEAEGENQHEEVIAEDYDDQKAPPKRDSANEATEKLLQEEFKKRMKGHPGCPNKYNIYHECTKFCIQHFGNGMLAPDPKYLLHKAAMLLQYPIPDGWKEVYDQGTGRFYYWNVAADTVSWFSPGHPKHAPSEPACALREEIKLAESDDEEEGSGSDDDNSEPEEATVSERRKKIPFMISSSFVPSGSSLSSHSKPKRAKREPELDPMDPAAYSDTPRGTWATGLLVRLLLSFKIFTSNFFFCLPQTEGKSGVDSTASGSLFQQRPLPSPGAVLRNKQKRK